MGHCEFLNVSCFLENFNCLEAAIIALNKSLGA
jgi:hypothetical protein